jgi:hypothetical protein
MWRLFKHFSPEAQYAAVANEWEKLFWTKLGQTVDKWTNWTNRGQIEPNLF